MIAVQTTPAVRQSKIEVLTPEQLTILLQHLEGQELYMPVLLAASTGLRRGELLALHWSDIDLDRATLRVTHSLELVGGKVSLKEPKTERSRRVISLPERTVAVLKAYRRDHAERCLALGLGRLELVFPSWSEGGLRQPQWLSKAFAAEIRAVGIPSITFHGLRHTHITHLLRSGVPVHVVSARAGHARPITTLNVYSHLLEGDQEKAAAIMDELLRADIKDR